MLNITIRGHDLSEVQTIEDLAENKRTRDSYTAARVFRFLKYLLAQMRSILGWEIMSNEF